MLTKNHTKLLLVTLIALIALVLFACNTPNDQPTDTGVSTQGDTVAVDEGTEVSTQAKEETMAEPDDTASEGQSETSSVEDVSADVFTEATTDVTQAETEEDTELDETRPVYIKQDWEEDGVLKILCLGNSFSVDSMEYLYGILDDMGVEEIKLGNLAIAGCSLSTHLNNAKSNVADYLYYENTTGTWKTGNGYVMADIIKSENWDFISLQQASHDSGVESTYASLDELLSIIEPLCPGARFVWHMTWAYQQDSTHGSFPVYNKDQMTMYNKIVSTVQAKVLTNDVIERVIPAGTAIQNARAGWIGDTLTRDGFHLSNAGRYMAALTFAQTVTGKSVADVTYVPSSVSVAEQTLAKEVAMLAVEKPFEVSVPTAEAPDTPSIEDLYELPLTFQKGYYAAITGGGKHLDVIYNDSDLANSFYSTQILTKEQLPVGSIIVIADGWQYRPEGWIGDAQLVPSSLRPSAVQQSMVVVDDNWWGDFTLRAFNVHKNPSAVLTDYTAEDMKDILKIYVPYDPTTMVPDPEPEPEPDDPLEGLYELSLDFQRGYYAATTGGGKHLDVIYNDSDLANSFYSTQILTKEQLPVGSVIVITEGWQYRPEGWIGDAQLTTARPSTVSTSMVVIDEAWWGDFTLRAFNVQTKPSSVLTNYTAEDMKSILKIYVPYDPSVSTDTTT